MANNNPFTNNFRVSSESRARNLASARRAIPLEAAASNSTSDNETNDSFSRFGGIRAGAGARAFHRDASVFNKNSANRVLRDISSLGAHSPDTDDVAEPTGATGVSFRGRGTHNLNNRAERRFSFESGLSGPSNGRFFLGNHEPGGAIRDGVENGTVDRQGNASSPPTFGADSRVAEVDGWDMWEAGGGGALTFGSLGFAMAGPPGAAVGVVLGAAGTMMYAVVKDASREKAKAEEEEKKAKAEKEEEAKTEEEEKKAKAEKEKEAKAKEEAANNSKTTPKPGDDNSNRPRNVSFEEMAALANRGSSSLINPDTEDGSPSSIGNVGTVDPFNRVRAWRDTHSRPTGYGRSGGEHVMPVGDARDSLVQPTDPDSDMPSTDPSTAPENQ